jgi:hypothetical protein
VLRVKLVVNALGRQYQPYHSIPLGFVIFQTDQLPTVEKFIKQIGRAKHELVVAIHPEMKESKKKRKGNRD